MPELRPFAGVRYAAELDAALVSCPPYDVVSPAEHSRLLKLHPNNFVRLILAPGGDEKYSAAAHTLRAWIDTGVLVEQTGESYYLYRTDHRSGSRTVSTAGLLGAVTLEELAGGSIHPHETTIAGPKADRLALMKATSANLEPLWFVATQEIPGLADVVDNLANTEPLADLLDPAGVRHRLWALPPDRGAPFAEHLHASDVLIADGHHRYETALTYRNERRSEGGPGGWDSTLAMISDPGRFAPSLMPIHRVAHDLRIDLASRTRLRPFDGELRALFRWVAERGAGTIGVAAGRTCFTTSSDGRLDTAYVGSLVEGADLAYEHDAGAVAGALASGATVFILAPVPLRTVIDHAQRGERMPPKTTMFSPKPRSGLVFRLLSPSDAIAGLG